eukprot:964908-Amphidinium_carterae.1
METPQLLTDYAVTREALRIRLAFERVISSMETRWHTEFAPIGEGKAHTFWERQRRRWVPLWKSSLSRRRSLSLLHICTRCVELLIAILVLTHAGSMEHWFFGC